MRLSEFVIGNQGDNGAPASKVLSQHVRDIAINIQDDLEDGIEDGLEDEYLSLLKERVYGLNSIASILYNDGMQDGITSLYTEDWGDVVDYVEEAARDQMGLDIRTMYDTGNFDGLN